MKKLSAFLNTPARVVIAVGLIILVSELLIMVLIETIHATVLQDPFVEKLAFEFLDPIALIAIVSPALYLLIFRPLNQQTELERQLDELRSFQRLSIGRELRIKELVEEIAALRNPLSAAPAGAIPVTSGSLEKLRHEAGQHATTQTMEDSQRSALLYQQLRKQKWFEQADLWSMTQELLALFDELTHSLTALPNDAEVFAAAVQQAYQARQNSTLQLEARLVFELWYAMQAGNELDTARAYQLRLAKLAAQAQQPLFVLRTSDWNAL